MVLPQKAKHNHFYEGNTSEGNVSYTVIKVAYDPQPKRLKALHQLGHVKEEVEEVQNLVPENFEATKQECPLELKNIEAEHSPGCVSGLDEKVPLEGKIVEVPESVGGAEETVELEDTITEYEKKRLQNVLRNQQFLQSLGIFNTKTSLELRTPKRTWTKYIPPPDKPLRRSFRPRIPSRRNSFPDEYTVRKKVPAVTAVSGKEKLLLDVEVAIKDKRLLEEEVCVKEKRLSDIEASVKKTGRDVERISPGISSGIERTVESKGKLTKYEKNRLQNVLRNQQFLQNLGINTKRNSVVRPLKKPWAKHSPPEGPLRRSVREKILSRKKLLSDAGYTGGNAAFNLNPVSDREKCPLFKTYTCAADTSPFQCDDLISVDWSNVVGFQNKETLVDSSLDEISSMDHILTEGATGLLVAADSHSRFAVFETNSASNLTSGSIRVSTRLERVAIEGDRKRASLCSWKRPEGFTFGGFVHSEIQFLSQQPQVLAQLPVTRGHVF